MTESIPQELQDRMVALVREIAGRSKHFARQDEPDFEASYEGSLKRWLEARAIVAELPPPVDPDVWLARDVCHSVIAEDVQPNTGAYLKGELDGSLSMRCALAAIRRIRQEGVKA